MKNISSVALTPEVKNETQFNNILGIQAYRSKVPICTEQFLHEQTLLRFFISEDSLKSVGDVIAKCETKGFYAKSFSNSVIIQSQGVLDRESVALDQPFPAVTFQGTLGELKESFLATALLSSKLASIFELGHQADKCSINLAEGKTVRDFLIAFSEQNEWGWDVFYSDLTDNKQQTNAALDLAGSIRFYKRSPLKGE